MLNRLLDKEFPARFFYISQSSPPKFSDALAKIIDSITAFLEFDTQYKSLIPREYHFYNVIFRRRKRASVRLVYELIFYCAHSRITR